MPHRSLLGNATYPPGGASSITGELARVGNLLARARFYLATILVICRQDSTLHGLSSERKSPKKHLNWVHEDVGVHETMTYAQ